MIPSFPKQFSRRNSSRAVFLDRDGTINRPVFRDGKATSPRTLAEFEIFPEVRKACALLVSHGFLVVVLTNQPEVGAGLLERQTLDDIHRLMCRLLPVKGVEVSFDPEDSQPSLRRDPTPGMLLDSAGKLGIDLSRSYMVGDSWRDVECGRRVGCQTVYIERGHGFRVRTVPDLQARDLMQAAQLIVQECEEGARSVAAWQPALLR